MSPHACTVTAWPSVPHRRLNRCIVPRSTCVRVQSSIRPYWRCYYPNTDAIIFVVDSTDMERMETARAELHAMLEVRGGGVVAPSMRSSG